MLLQFLIIFFGLLIGFQNSVANNCETIRKKNQIQAEIYRIAQQDFHRQKYTQALKQFESYIFLQEKCIFDHEKFLNTIDQIGRIYFRHLHNPQKASDFFKGIAKFEGLNEAEEIEINE